jgi:hypothetical protein
VGLGRDKHYERKKIFTNALKFENKLKYLTTQVIYERGDAGAEG